MYVFASRFLAVCLAVACPFVGCQGVRPRKSSIAVSLNETSADVSVGGTVQFGAVVTGTTNTAVTWSVDAVPNGTSQTGLINASGLYTAPLTAGTHSVTATSVADP